jgi:hypothetical protein
MLEEADPNSDPEELRIELMAAGLNAVAAMGGGTKEEFMEMAKEAAEEHLNGDDEHVVPQRVQQAGDSGKLQSPIDAAARPATIQL